MANVKSQGRGQGWLPALVLSVIALVGLLANPAAYAQSNTVTVVHELGSSHYESQDCSRL